MIARPLLAWLGLMVLAISNGAFREAVITPRLGAGKAHLASTLLLCISIFLLAWFLVPWIAPTSPAQAFVVGGMWLLMTLVFEFGFGRLVAKKSWAELLADYDILSGRVWLLVLLTVCSAPYFVASARRLY